MDRIEEFGEKIGMEKREQERKREERTVRVWKDNKEMSLIDKF